MLYCIDNFCTTSEQTKIIYNLVTYYKLECIWAQSLLTLLSLYISNCLVWYIHVKLGTKLDYIVEQNIG